MGVIKAYSVNGLVPSTITTSGSTIVYFPDLPGSNLWNVGAFGVNTGISSQFKGLQPTASTNAGGLQVPGNSELDGQQFEVLASGNVLFAAAEASTTAKVGLYLSNVAAGTAPAYQTLIELTLTNQTLDNVAYPWYLAVKMQGDTASGVLQLSKSGAINGTVTTPTQVTALTGISFATNPAFTLVAGVTFGNAAAGNQAQLKQFQVTLM
jgi:hypothetical protein